MSNTKQSDGMGRTDSDELTQALTDYLNRALTAQTSKRDVDDDATDPAQVPLPAPEPGDLAERWLPIVAAILPAVVQAVPAIIDALRDRNRDLRLFDEAAGNTERELAAVLGVLVPQVINLLPQLVQALGASREVPRSGDDATARFLMPLLTTLVPMIVNAAPSIVAALTGQSRDVQGTSASSPEFAHRFLGPLLGAVIPLLAQAVPSLIAAVTGQARGTQLNWINFTGQWLPDGDAINMDEWDIEPGFIEFELTQPYGTWGKALRLMIGGTQVDRAEVRNENRTSHVIRVPVDQVRGAGYLEFVKAKMFGVMTGMYQLGGLEQKSGKHLRFNWLHS
ncbi:hypothetical protein [Actinoplanes aureus]|uniref:Uncharacterized protein n=1 Tax=Actinoplanes aureus TaxID=2792083 RepID=A0A931CL54_9ACTN|nr:hypothetical protein [Actinoplanes aureus]MBG0568421.1 hypothetical protein [Actinoplanes aureus]